MSANASSHAIADEKYVAFTTYKKDGTTKTVPVWIVDLGDGTVGFTTASSSWKAKRLANNNNVHLQPSDARGTPKDGSARLDATAVASPADYDRVWPLVLAKYGIQARAIKLMGKFMKLIGKGSGTDTAVIVTVV